MLDLDKIRLFFFLLMLDFLQIRLFFSDFS